MELIPAIDIRDRKCVRLYQGDYNKETIYSKSPSDVAVRWETAGASSIHIVDLDGAKAGTPVNLDLVENIVSSVNIKVQLGGGIRTLESAEKARSIGVNRIVMGTTAVQDPNSIQKICEEIGSETFVVSIDAKDSQVVINGWTQDSTLDIFELINRIESMGVKRFVYTDITKDGTLTNPNFKTIEQIANKTSLNMLVAGGISSTEHLITLSELGIEGAIVGKAIYTGDIDIQKANQVLKKVDKKIN